MGSNDNNAAVRKRDPEYMFASNDEVLRSMLLLSYSVKVKLIQSSTPKLLSDKDLQGVDEVEFHSRKAFEYRLTAVRQELLGDQYFRIWISVPFFSNFTSSINLLMRKIPRP